MPDLVLTINAGSSSLKFACFRVLGDGEPVCGLRGQLSGIGQGEAKFSVSGLDAAAIEWGYGTLRLQTHFEALTLLLERIQMALGRDVWRGVGHRIVHGGDRFSEPVQINSENLAQLKDLILLAPLHQPHNIAAVEAIGRALPHLPQVACFDTAFHARQPELAARFALPERYWLKGIRRYGFHGLSYEAIMDRLPEIMGTLPERLVIAHLGNGASMAAIGKGQCIATTMGFTALDGLIMGTRAGNLDPGILLHLMRHEGLDLAALEKLLYHESGLLAVSGRTSDMRALLAAEDSRSRLAVELYCYRVNRELGSLIAALEGIDALVFTGGIGENAPAIRSRVCRAAAWTGLDFDAGTNEAGGPRISTSSSSVAAFVVPTDEELVIARHTTVCLRTARR
jgi:acetate kinase